MHEDGSYSKYAWYTFHYNYYKQLNKEMLLDLHAQIPQYTTDAVCSTNCICPDKSRKATEEEKESALNSKNKETTGKSNIFSSYKRNKKRTVEMFDMSEIEYDKEDAADKLGKEINKAAMSGIGKISKTVQTLSLWDVLKIVLMIVQLKLLYVTFKAQY